MVLIWNDLACGDREGAAVLVALNSLFQIVAYSLLGYFYLTLLPGWLGLDTQGFEVSIWEVARTVLIFLGIPLARRLPDPAHRHPAPRPRLVREHVHPAHQPDHALRAAVHDRAAVRDPGRRDHGQPARRRADRAAAARLLPGHVRRLVRARQADRARLRPHDGARLHRRQQQLRARDRRLRRRLRRHLRARRSPASSAR